MGNAGSVLLLDDEKEILWSLEKFLNKKGFQVQSFNDGKEAINYIKSRSPVDIIVSDIRMPTMDGIEFLTCLKKLSYAPPVVMMTAYGSVKNAVEAMKAGAYDYLTKPFEVEELILVINRAMELVSLRKEVQRLRNEMERRYSINGLVAKSMAMQSILLNVSRMASEQTPVLFIGDSGTGKHFFSQVIHRSGNREDMPFEIVTCSALPQSSQESHIFGDKDDLGMIQKAHKGILFLDDIDSLSLQCQHTLLTYLETGRYVPQGTDKPVTPDTRIISAMMGSCDEAEKSESFHPDLYFKLSPFAVELPQLIKRREDIPILIESFLESFCKESNLSIKNISREAYKVLLNYAWPGNVRELQNVIERAVILSSNDHINLEDLPPQVTRLSEFSTQQLPTNYTLLELEKAYIYQVLQENDNHQGNTAKILGIDRKTLWRKIKNYYQSDRDK